MLSAISFVALAGLFASTRAGGLPECYIDPYAAALNTTTCGPLDVNCVCQSNTYLNELQDGVPQACNTTDQVPIFSYIMAACSEFNAAVTLTTTSVPITTSTIPIMTITSTLSLTAAQTGSATAGALAAAAASDCPKQNLSSGASVAIIIAAFIIGGLLFTAGAVRIMRRRKTRVIPEQIHDMPYTPHSTANSYSFYGQNKPLPVEAAAKGPRAEMMYTESTGSHGRPAELL